MFDTNLNQYICRIVILNVKKTKFDQHFYLSNQFV